MQLMINIPKEQYNMILQSDNTAMAACVSKEAMMYAIKSGKVLSEMTNGDMIKVMFPNEYKYFYDRSYSDWWNAPYESEEK